MWQFQIPMNDHAVVSNRRTGIFGFIPLIVVSSSGKVDVVGLPRERGQAHVHDRLADRVNSAALIVFAIEPKRVQNLQLIPTLHVNPTVAPSLPTTLRHEWSSKFDMKMVISKFLFGETVGGSQKPPFDQLTVFEPLCGRSIKEHHRVFGWLGPEGRALSLGLLEFGNLIIVAVVGRDRAVLQHGPAITILRGKFDFAVSQGPFGSDRLTPAGPPLTGQTAVVADQIKFPFSKSDNLDPQFERRVFRSSSQILALISVVGWRFFHVGVSRIAIVSP